MQDLIDVVLRDPEMADVLKKRVLGVIMAEDFKESIRESIVDYLKNELYEVLRDDISICDTMQQYFLDYFVEMVKFKLKG